MNASLNDERSLVPYKLQLLPYLKSFFVFFKQLITLPNDDPSMLHSLSNHFLSIWSVMTHLVSIGEKGLEFDDNESTQLRSPKSDSYRLTMKKKMSTHS